MIFIELIFDAAPEVRDEVVSLARRTAAATHQEEGCILYRFTNDIDLPNRFILNELWESEDALITHFRGEACKTFWEELPKGGDIVSSASWKGPLVSYTPPNPVE
jgi:quinol monooxygenase YgiN